ncbi:MAG: tetratricopeptide repeat protein [Gemmatimonadota bacterium]
MGSQHDLAMAAATDSTVLGDFDDATFTIDGRTTEFFRRDGGYGVRAAGPDGAVGEYEVAYTFGVEPLQQYLISFPGGRYQALDVAWDARPEADGGQRWFHLYPDDPPAPGDPLHWTGLDQTWNYQCAECHSTNLERNYDAATDVYSTTWSEIDVSCEACHGPGSAHVRWAEVAGPDARIEPGVGGGGILRLGSKDGAGWTFAPGESIARRTVALSSRTQIETCARCHSRRGVISGDYAAGEPILDSHRVSLLDEGLYHADGQIQDEVYVYGSFLQSRMYRAGVTCTDCHDPHTAELKAEGNALCGGCHLPTVYDTPDHTLHPIDAEGAQCVDCHMPATTYMIVDPRRDHGFRIPRPDLSADIGAPDACTGCHTDQTQRWAADILANRFGVDSTRARYGRTIHAARRGDPRIAGALSSLVTDSTESAMVRATAASLLGRIAGPTTGRALRAALRDPSPLVRLGALQSLDGAAIAEHWRSAYALLDDPIRAVRLEAGRRLAMVPADALTPPEADAVARGVEAFLESQLVNAERPEAYLNIAATRAARGSPAEALEALETALLRDPAFVPAYVNLADLFRAMGVDSQVEATLRQGLEIVPDDPSLLHALGLTLTRRRQMDEAVDLLARAAELAPETARYGYVYGIALNSIGDVDGAVAALERALLGAPFDQQVLVALATISRDAGRTEQAVRYARRIVELWPDDPGARQLLDELNPNALRGS